MFNDLELEENFLTFRIILSESFNVNASFK